MAKTMLELAPMIEATEPEFEVTVEKASGSFWMWRLSLGGRANLWGLSSSQEEARSDAQSAIEECRQLAEDNRVMGTILG